ncbi:MAG: KipI antagonist, partial [Bacteroidota bacterium]
ARCYIAIHGGPYADKWLNSYSTNLKAAAGGKDGRPLRKGDEIHFKENTIYFAGLLNSDANFRALPWSADNTKIYYHPHEISVIVGKEWNELERSSQENFIDNNFMIHPSSDRMGYQLKGSPMLLKNSFDLISSGVDFGTIQLLPDGQLIILMADHQTTGGYPRIAHVISAHLPKLAQLRPSDCVKFNIVSIEAAEEMLFARQKELQVLHRACSDHLNALVC